jgi:hypothetical protein
MAWYVKRTTSFVVGTLSIIGGNYFGEKVEELVESDHDLGNHFKKISDKDINNIFHYMQVPISLDTKTKAYVVISILHLTLKYKDGLIKDLYHPNYKRMN